MVYNKIDQVESVECVVDSTQEQMLPTNNYPLPTIYISAAKKQNIDALRNLLYGEIARIHAIRYPYNNFLY